MKKINNEMDAYLALQEKIRLLFPDAFYEFYLNLMQKAESQVDQENDLSELKACYSDDEEWYDFLRDLEHDFITERIREVI